MSGCGGFGTLFPVCDFKIILCDKWQETSEDISHLCVILSSGFQLVYVERDTVKEVLKIFCQRECQISIIKY